MIDTFALLKSSSAVFLATLLCTWLLRPVACHIGLVDSPGGRKWHANDVPLIGGIAMFLGFCFALAILPIPFYYYRGLLVGSGLLILIGAVDDLYEISSRPRLLGQLFACFFLIAWGGKVVTNLGNLFFAGDIHLNGWSAPVTIFAVMGFINAMNMVDGQDGLAGGVALTQIFPLLFLSILLGRINDTLLLITIATLLSAFLFFNMPLPWRRNATVFLGDAGSGFIAFVIAWFATNVSQSHAYFAKPITILWILALPLFDLISACTFRIKNDISPFRASRDHLHHILHARGLNQTISTLLMCLLSLAFATTGLILGLLNIPEGWSFLAFLITLTCYLIFVRVVKDN